MTGNALREGFREVLQDPALLLIEIAWRWSFGAIALCVCAVSAFALMGGAVVDSHRLNALVALTPWQLAQVLAASVAAVGLALLRVMVAATVILAVCWVLLSSIGRRATLARSALAPGATLRGCFAINTTRALATVGSIFVWLAAGIVAGVVAAITARGAMPNLALIAAILFPSLLVIAMVWITANWYLSLAPLFREQSWARSLLTAWNWCRANRDELFEISIVLTVMRAILLVVALMLSFAVSAVVTNIRVVVADLLAISLLYFLIADFLYVSKLAACAKLRMKSHSQAAATTSAIGFEEQADAQAGAPVPHA